MTRFGSMPTICPRGGGEFYAKCGYREMGRVTYRGAPLIYHELLL